MLPLIVLLPLNFLQIHPEQWGPFACPQKGVLFCAAERRLSVTERLRAHLFVLTLILRNARPATGIQHPETRNSPKKKLKSIFLRFLQGISCFGVLDTCSWPGGSQHLSSYLVCSVLRLTRKLKGRCLAEWILLSGFCS